MPAPESFAARLYAAALVISRAEIPLPDGWPHCGRVWPLKKVTERLRQAEWPFTMATVNLPQHEHSGRRTGQRTADAPQPVACCPLPWLQALADHMGEPLPGLVRGTVRDSKAPPPAPAAKRKPAGNRGPARGHWPEGKRRKPSHTGVAGAVRLLKGLIDRHGLRGAGRMVGVDARTVSRWVRGDRFPDPDDIAKIKAAEDAQ